MVFMKIMNRINVLSARLSVKLVINQPVIVQAVTFKEISKIYKLKIKILICIHVLIARMVNLKISKTIVDNVTQFVILALNKVRHAYHVIICFYIIILA
jgi:hypothetical protein